MERESRLSSGLSSNPASKTKIWKYQVSKHSIKAEAADNLKKPHRPEKASIVNPVHVFLHLSLLRMYTNCASAMIHQDKLSTKDTPKRPSPILWATTQDRSACSKRVRAEMQALGNTMLWVLRNLRIGKLMA